MKYLPILQTLLRMSHKHHMIIVELEELYAIFSNLPEDIQVEVIKQTISDAREHLDLLTPYQKGGDTIVMGRGTGPGDDPES